MSTPTASRAVRIAAVALLAGWTGAAAAARIVPAEPTEFEPVNLRMTVDSCTFAPSTVRVASESNTLRVAQRPNNCLLPGPEIIVDVRLGSLPAGDYRVEIFATPQREGDPVETLGLSVRPPVEIAIYPPPPRPLTDYSGVWWNAAESGWGLSLHQGALHGVFATLQVYDADHRPQWFVAPGGRWTGSTTWTGTLYRTSGPFVGDPTFDPGQVQVDPTGSLTLDFSQVPGTEGRARLTYTIDGLTATRTITRMPF